MLVNYKKIEIGLFLFNKYVDVENNEALQHDY